MNTQLATLHSDLTLMVATLYVIKGSVSPNPRILDDERRGLIIRYFVVGINLGTAQQQLQRALEKRALPYRLVNMGMALEQAGGSTYIDFVEKKSK